MRTRDQIKKALAEALSAEFPTDSVDVSDGYGNNIRVVVVSRRFDSMTDSEQQDLLWGAISKTNLDESERAIISLTLTESPSVIK